MVVRPDPSEVVRRSASHRHDVDIRADVEIWVDGSCGADGWGGWAAILIGRHGRVRPMCGSMRPDSLGADKVTNQQMEMYAVIRGLDELTKSGLRVIIYSDSAYVVNCFHQLWLPAWRARGWRTAGGKEVKNRVLWETLESLVEEQRATFRHVAGHADGKYPWNEQADMLARAVRVRDSQAEILREARKARIERPTGEDSAPRRRSGRRAT